MIKVNGITNHKTWNCVPFCINQWEEHNIIFLIYLPKCTTINKKNQTNSNWGTLSKIIGLWSSSFKMIKAKERMKNCSKSKEIKERWTWYVTPNWFFGYKGSYLETLWKLNEIWEMNWCEALILMIISMQGNALVNKKFTKVFGGNGASCQQYMHLRG